ncbi:MAG: hypothetical protein HBSAPP02_23590 [Phycisphaerae bacterium]|nr:MAG: hypothetical protein HBSAPP02_23590 [Phycisphaerae bacterium]
MIDALRDAPTIRRFLELLFEPGDIFEVRAIDCRECRDARYAFTCSGYFTFEPLDAAAAAIAELDRSAIAPGIYVTMNPVVPALLARAANRIKPRARETTQDKDILRRRWLLVDVDPARPAGVSSTDAELALAHERARAIADHLASIGWPAPLFAMSGNGYHLLYRIGLPADDGGLVKAVLAALADQFSDDAVAVDRAVHNSARIVKVVGTVSRKGDDLRGAAGLEDRPHRRSEFVNVPEQLAAVPEERLRAVAGANGGRNDATQADVAAPATNGGEGGGRFDCTPAGVRTWLEAHGAAVKGERRNGDKTLLLLERCPINPEIVSTGGSDIAVLVGDDGKLAYCNKHNRGQVYTWHDLRRALDPGYAGPFGLEACDVDLSQFGTSTRQSTDGRTDRVASPHPGPFPSHLLAVPGFVGAVVAYTVASAIKPQPVLALGAAIALVGTLVGRKVRDEMNTRTNVYCLGVCETGGGKERARQVNKEILFQAGLERMAGPEGLASHAGLVSAVEKQPSILFQLDEIGRLLRTIGEPSRSPHLYHIATVLMKLFTSASSVYIGDAYADSKRNKTIDQPNACVYGTTVPKSLYEGLTAESVTDGFLSRMLIFETDDHDPVPSPDANPATAVPSAIVDVAYWWGEFNPAGNLAKEHPEPRVVTTSTDAARVFIELEQRARGERQSATEAVAALWTRTTEKARKLALIHACSANHEAPVIDEAAARWAAELSEYLTRRTLHIAEEWVSETPFEAKRKRVLREIGRSRAGMTRTQLNRKTKHLTAKERGEIIESLLSTGEVIEERVQTGGAPRVTYRANSPSCPPGMYLSGGGRDE